MVCIKMIASGSHLSARVHVRGQMVNRTNGSSASHEQQTTSSQNAQGSEYEQMTIRSDLLTDDGQEEHDPE